ncbi:hypothetical protein [Curtobacterium flaccumfaciens]|uniref:hypothetical protein n=1 Tax=Curtobacterium flaccumfaciens TaxID=2035 RepID=UPI001BDDFCA1|nr:hypothetical protein [Curtobacterium flaccumfaciens]MBT1683437.1 hypothetical protein [Curtobacterium flaccumfaciens pv. flaccumfaciens]
MLFIVAAIASLSPRLPMLVRAVPSVVLVVLLLLAETLQLVPGPPGLPMSVLGTMGVGLVTILGGSATTAAVLDFAMRDGVRRGQHGGILVADIDEPFPERQQQEVLRGGAVIGFLERFAIVGAASVGHLEIVAAAIAIKGLGRFTELDSAAARERFIVGTLTSMCWAGLGAAAMIALPEQSDG